MDELHRSDDVVVGARIIRERRVPRECVPTQLLKFPAVWEALLTIPYGETRSYGEIARQIGSPGAFRAVGLANGHNPIGIIVPCHRVIGSNGSLTGYGGGLGRKRALLALETSRLAPALTLFD